MLGRVLSGAPADLGALIALAIVPAAEETLGNAGRYWPVVLVVHGNPPLFTFCHHRDDNRLANDLDLISLKRSFQGFMGFIP